MENKIKRMYDASLEKVRNFFEKIGKWIPINNFISYIIEKIKNSGNGSSWVNIAALITNILGFAAYCVISPVLAEYQREKGIRIFSVIAIAIIILIMIWELACLIGYEQLSDAGKFLRRLHRKRQLFFQKYFSSVAKVIKPIWFIFAVCIIIIVFVAEWTGKLFGWIKNKVKMKAERCPQMAGWLITLFAVVVIIVLFCTPKVTYCTSVKEIYGIPSKSGEELTAEKRKNCAAYWEIKDYPFLRFMKLTYVEPYQQLGLMEQYSTAYGMKFFRPSASIEIHYKRDRDKYLSMNQSAFAVAKKNGFREPVKVSYYNSSNKLILELEKNNYGKFDIMRYSSTDRPQLLNSTLLYTKDEQIIENSMTSQQVEIIYNSEGLPEKRRLSSGIYNSNGINGEYYVYDQNQRLATLYYLDINGEFVCNKQGIMMIDFQYEDNGNLRSIRYYGGEEREKKTEGYQGVFCEQLSYDSYGNLKERSQRDRNENLRSDINGVCMYRYSYNYDESNALVKEEFLGVAGEPVKHNQFYSTMVEFEMAENIDGKELIILLDKAGSSVETIDYPADVAIEEEGYLPLATDKGNFLEQAVFMDWGQSADRQDAQEASGKQVVQDTSEKQDNQHILSASPLNDNEQGGQAVISKQSIKQLDQIQVMAQYYQPEELEKDVGKKDDNTVYPEEETDIIRKYVSIHCMIDRNGCISQFSYYDDEKQLVPCEDGYAIKSFQYDQQKRITDEKYWDKSKKLCCINDGYAIVRNTYESDRNDNIKLVEYLDINEKLVLNQALGYAYVEYARMPEDKSETICKRYFNENGEAVRLPGLGYAMVKEHYNERNFLVWEAYYDESDQKTCRTDYGVAEIRYEYEDSGNRIRELYKDCDGRVVNRFDTGFAAVYWKYEGGQMIDCHYEGYQNQMLRAVVDRRKGIAGIRYTYENGRKIREEYYDEKGMPSFRTDIGCAIQTFEYDGKGEVCTEAYYGLDGEPVLRKDTGYAMVTYRDNENGQRCFVRFYDKDGRLVIGAKDHCAGYNYTYDDRGNREKVQYVGLDEELMIRRDLGYAQVKYKYDAHGNVKEGRYFDEDGKPAIRKGEGYAWYTSKYDDDGNWLETCYYIGEGETPVLRQDKGYFKVVNEYYDDGKLKSQKFYGLGGEPELVISTEYGCAGFEYEYDDEYECDYENKFGLKYEQNEKGIRKTIRYIGLDGKPMIRKELGFAVKETIYDKEDHAIFEVYFDDSDDKNITVRKEGGYAAFQDIFENGTWIEGRYYDIDGKLTLRNDNGYAVIKNEYDEYGQRIKEYYYGEDGESLIISSKYQCAGFIFDYDEKGNKKYVRYINTEKEPMVRRDLGYASMALEYDNVGNKISEAYFDIDGQPVVCKDGGYASYVSEYENVKCMETRYYDRKGRLTLRKDEGYAVVKNTYDDYGQCTAQTYYDASGQLNPIIAKNQHCAGLRYKYDERGNKTDVKYLDLDENLMVRRDLGYARISMKYDDIGNKIEESYYDIWNNPAIDKAGGYSYYQNFYDERGKLHEVKYFIENIEKNGVDMLSNKMERSAGSEEDKIEEEKDKEGRLVLRKDTGYAQEVYEYDDLGQEVSCSYYGVDGEPVISTKYLCAGFEYGYDERGNQTDIYYLGLEGEKEYIVRRDLGFAHIQKEYDLSGNLENESYYDADENPVTYMDYGYACRKNIYKKGRVAETKYYDEWGDLAIHGEEGYAMIRYEYDDYGQCISQFYYDTQEQPVISTKHYCAGIEYEYDERGNETDVCYLGLDGYPVIRRDLGFACKHLDFNEYDKEIRRSYYDIDRETYAKWEKSGASIIKCKYGEGGCEEWYYFDEQNERILREDTGYASVRYEYDIYGQSAAEYYYDVKGEPVISRDRQCAGRRFGYDEKGNQTDFQFIGPDGLPAMHEKNGYAQSKCEYDDFNNKTKEAYMDADGQLIVRQDLGYAQIKWEYNASGKQTREAYFDAEDEPAVWKEGGYAYCTVNYNDGEDRRYFAVDGKPAMRKDMGCAIIIYQYDESGQCTGESYFDSDGERIICSKNSCAAVTYEYDERGRVIKIWYWGTDGKVTEREDIGIAGEYKTYNKYGQLTAVEYWKVDPEDETVMVLENHKNLGYASVEYQYEDNKWVRTEYFDADGNYIAPGEREYAIYEQEWNEMQLVGKEAYYNAEGELINCINGKAAIVEYTYDPFGNVVEWLYRDKNGEVINW